MLSCSIKISSLSYSFFCFSLRSTLQVFRPISLSCLERCARAAHLGYELIFP